MFVDLFTNNPELFCIFACHFVCISYFFNVFFFVSFIFFYISSIFFFVFIFFLLMFFIIFFFQFNFLSFFSFFKCEIENIQAQQVSAINCRLVVAHTVCICICKCVEQPLPTIWLVLMVSNHNETATFDDLFRLAVHAAGVYLLLLSLLLLVLFFATLHLFVLYCCFLFLSFS